MLELSTAEMPVLDDVEARAPRVVQQIGVQGTEIERLPFDLSVLSEEGIFLNVDAQGFGLLDRRLDWQALGISLPRNTDVAFRPPRCGLLPDRYRLPLMRPAARTHQALRRYSYRFRLTETLFETVAYRWVPWRAFEAFERDFETARLDLESAKLDILAHYDAVREEVIQTFLQLATDSGRRLQATGQTVPDGFANAVVQEVLTAMPTREELRNKLVLRYQVGIILLGSEMLAEQRKASEERQQLEDREVEMRLERQRQQAREHRLQTELWAEEEMVRQRVRAAEDERRRAAEIKERLRGLKLDAAKERLQEAMSPLEEGAKQLHAAVYETAVAIRTSLEQHEYLPGASAKRARDLSRWFKVMNWQSDEQLETLVTELEGLARKPTGKQKRDAVAINHVLGDIIELCYADARDLSQAHRMSALEL